jgi:hypothetical protein
MNSLGSTINKPLVNRNHYNLLVFFILAELLILFAFIHGYIVIVLSIILGLVFFLFSAFSVERSFYFMAFYYFAIPSIGDAPNFRGWQIFFTWYLGLPLFIWLLGNWFLYLIWQQLHNKPLSYESNLPHALSFRTMDKLLLIFIISFSISAILGFLRGFDRLYWIYNYVNLLMYISYFIFLYTPLSINPRRLFDFVILCSFLASVQYIYSIAKFGGLIVLRRISSEHIHLTQLALPYLAAIILYDSAKFRRFLSGILFPVILVGMLLCQQRSLYGSVFITLVMLILIFAFEKRRILFRNAPKIIYGGVATIVFLGGLYFIAHNLTQGKLTRTVFSRILLFLSPKMLQYDLSAIIRINEIKTALSSVGSDFLFGRGLGDGFISRWRDIHKNTVDNTFAFLYWQTGLVGLTSFIAVIIYFLKRCITTLRKNLLVEEKIFVLASFLNFIGMLIVAMINVSLAGFRVIFIWAATFAVVESIARKYDGKISPNTPNVSQ